MSNANTSSNGSNLAGKEELHRLLLENSIDALIVGDMNGDFVYASPSMKQLFGYEPEEVIGRNSFEFFHPEDVTVNKGRLAQLLEGKEFQPIELRFKKKNGDYLWCEDTIRMVHTSQGGSILVIVARDISERKKMQDELKKYSENLERTVQERTLELNKANSYLTQLISRLPLALIAWNKQYKVTTWNPQATKMFGFSEQEFLGNNLNALFRHKEVTLPLSAVWMNLQKGDPADIECENITKNDISIVCNWTNMPLRNEDGNLYGVLSIVQDFTEKRKLETRLKEITYSLSGVKAGESYLTSSLQRALKTAFDLSSHGTRGLYMVRDDPDSIVRDYNFKPEDIVLVSSKPMKDFKAVNELQEIAVMINKFLRVGGGVVVLGGIEYLISRHGFNPVFMMIQEKRFEILEAGGTLLVPINMETLDVREKGLLGSELKFLN